MNKRYIIVFDIGHLKKKKNSPRSPPPPSTSQMKSMIKVIFGEQTSNEEWRTPCHHTSNGTLMPVLHNQPYVTWHAGQEDHCHDKADFIGSHVISCMRETCAHGLNSAPSFRAPWFDRARAGSEITISSCDSAIAVLLDRTFFIILIISLFQILIFTQALALGCLLRMGHFT